MRAGAYCKKFTEVMRFRRRVRVVVLELQKGHWSAALHVEFAGLKLSEEFAVSGLARSDLRGRG